MTIKYIAFCFLLTLSFLAIEAKTVSCPRKKVMDGIHWISGLTWEQILEKAHDENKYVFVDCFATWCGPCKVMDKFVYGNDTIGHLMSSRFICVRLQMDSTQNDKEEIKKWYKIARSMAKEYAIKAFPTFLFFAPNGQIVHKDVGGKDIKQFISLIDDIDNPSKQYYRLLWQYHNGKLEFTKMPFLATTARSFGERELADSLIRTYITKYLDRDQQKYFTRENQQFIYSYLFGILRSSDKLFSFYLNQPEKMDSVLGKPGYSKQLVDFVITKEEITTSVDAAEEQHMQPLWKKIAKRVNEKYGSKYSERNVLNAKVSFYKTKKDWTIYTKYLVQKVENEKKHKENSYQNATSLNQNAWEVFLYSNRKSDLKKALEWSHRSLQLIDTSSFNVGPYMDTQANLLYKLQKTADAISFEKQAIQRMIYDAEKFDFIKRSLDSYKKILQKMENGLPTYLEEGAIWK